MLRNKLKITISLILLTLFCCVSIFSQDKSCERYELLKKASFTGEKISFKYVNTDIRDILHNIITEQYGYQFVIDKSVKEVPITVNLRNVPWKIAIEKILESQGMTWEIHCTVIRIIEEEKLHIVRHLKKEKSPLYTEFIRLKNVPSCPNSKAEKSWRMKSSCKGYKIGFFKLITSLGVYLSMKGTIEMDARSNTLIITDIQENIAYFRKIIVAFDYPEMYKISEEEYKEYKIDLSRSECCGFATQCPELKN